MKKSVRRYKRRGATAVEFALVAPILFLMIFAGLEFTRVNMIRNTIENAAYAGARQGLIAGATASDCSTAAQQYLTALNINTSNVTVNPAVLSATDPTVTVTVNVTLDGSSSYVWPAFFFGKNLQSSMSLSKL